VVHIAHSVASTHPTDHRKGHRRGVVVRSTACSLSNMRHRTCPQALGRCECSHEHVQSHLHSRFGVPSWAALRSSNRTLVTCRCRPCEALSLSMCKRRCRLRWLSGHDPWVEEWHKWFVLVSSNVLRYIGAWPVESDSHIL
jgi:hypothetical protein